MLLKISEAATLVNLSRQCLERLEKRGLLDFERIGGRLFIDLDQLCKAPILTIGRAARVVDRSWRTAKRWLDAGYLNFYYEPFPNAKRRTSIDEIYIAKNQIRGPSGTAGKS